MQDAETGGIDLRLRCGAIPAVDGVIALKEAPDEARAQEARAEHSHRRRHGLSRVAKLRSAVVSALHSRALRVAWASRCSSSTCSSLGSSKTQVRRPVTPRPRDLIARARREQCPERLPARVAADLCAADGATAPRTDGTLDRDQLRQVHARDAPRALIPLPATSSSRSNASGRASTCRYPRRRWPPSPGPPICTASGSTTSMASAQSRSTSTSSSSTGYRPHKTTVSRSNASPAHRISSATSRRSSPRSSPMTAMRTTSRTTPSSSLRC